MDDNRQSVSSEVKDQIQQNDDEYKYCWAGVKIKESKADYIMKQGAFQRWTQKYVVLEDNKLSISKDPQDKNKEIISLVDAVVTEASLRNTRHIFLVITAMTTLTFCTKGRRELQSWVNSLKHATLMLKHRNSDLALNELSRQHTWFVSNHSSRTFCNVCGDALHGMAWNGLSCEECRFKCHRRCATSVTMGCKWTTKESIAEDKESVLDNGGMPHQWLEGNLPTGSKCVVCQKACGSATRLQDYRCLWCKQTVHCECKESVERECSLGIHSHLVLAPSVLRKSDYIKKGLWETCDNRLQQNPCLALVNSRSGDNQGVRFLRRFKQLLNPLQVYDIATCGPELPLQLFQKLSKCFVVICGGDGSLGWVLANLDKLNMHDQCIIGTIPLGTGNDLSRVLGWGATCDDDQKLAAILHEMEHSGVRLLDRWAIQHTPDIAGQLKGHKELSPTSRSCSPDSLGDNISNEERPKFNTMPQSGVSQSTWYVTDLARTPDPPEELEGEVETETEKCEVTFDRSSLEEDDSHSNSTNGSGELDDERHQLLRISSSNELDVDDHEIPVVRPSKEGEIDSKLTQLQGSLASHLKRVMFSEDDKEVISSSRVLYAELKKLTKSVIETYMDQLGTEEYQKNSLVQKWIQLDMKVENLVSALSSEASSFSEGDPSEVQSKKKFIPRDALMARTESLKRAANSVVEQAALAVVAEERTSDEVRALTEEAIQVQTARASGERPAYLPTTSTPAAASLISPLSVLSPADISPLEQGTHQLREVGTMNNYFGIGLDAKITYEFHTRREENPKQYTSRAKNIVLFGLLGGKEFLQGSHRGFENRIRVICDGKLMKLPRGVQGIVALNIPSYMAGTNFWGTERSTRNFSAPAIDDKLIEVVAVTGTNMATTKVFKFQFSNHRIAQCRTLSIIVDGKDKIPVQADGEAWLQDPGVITISHKNKARMVIRDKAFSSSLQSWNQSKPSRKAASERLKSHSSDTLITSLDDYKLQTYKTLVFTTQTLISCLKVEAQQNLDVKTNLLPIAIEATRAMNVVFPHDKESDMATTAQLKEMELRVKTLLQETRWFINMKKISQDYEIVVKDAIQRVEGVIRSILYPKKNEEDSKEVGPSRHYSDSKIQFGDKTDKCTLVAYYHRQRCKQLELVSATDKTGRYTIDEVLVWDIEQVCGWLQEINFGQYRDQFKAHEVNGKKLLELQKADLMDMGITKIDHLTYLQKHVQNFKPTLLTKDLQ